jgi:translation initiation factor IF-2
MRICDLAKELMTTGKELLGLLQARGCTARSTQANLTPELEQYLRDEIQRIYYGGANAPAPAPETPAASPEAAATEAPAETNAAEAPAATDAPAAATAEPAAEATPAPEAPAEPAEPEGPRTLAIKGHVVVKEFADMLGVKPNVLITELMRLNIFASIGMKIEFKIAQKVAEKFGVALEHEKKTTPPPPPPKTEPKPEEAVPDLKDDLLPRPPVVTFMGHVDHGKTSLLDFIRKAHVVDGESGGITQHIGAYQVEYDGRLITFLDTPGHEAFTAMRARGANLTDIAVIVIAADDGIMPQTKEAIQHAQAAKVAMIIAINKCDLRTANPDRVKRQLQQMGLAPEDWGGELICCSVSATSGDGMDHLLEMILLQAEVLELRANPRRRATGYVIESRLEAGMGPTANILITNGTLQLNDAIVSGSSWGRVKAMINDQGIKVRTAGPSAAVKILGLTSVPAPGSEFHVYKNDREARQVAEERAAEKRLVDLAGSSEARPPMTLEELLQEKTGSDKRTLNVIVKTDVLGSLEAIRGSLEGINSDKVDLDIIGTGVGNVSVNDVLLASASKAVILGFHVGKDTGSGAEAKRKGVEIRLYSIIYEMLDDVKNLMTGLLDPIVKEHINGHAVIRQIFDMGKRGKVAGCMCQKGKVTLKGRARVRRKDEIVYEGKIQTLRRFQNEANEVREGQECGIVLDRFTDIAEGDLIESYEIEKVAQAL